MSTGSIFNRFNTDDRRTSVDRCRLEGDDPRSLHRQSMITEAISRFHTAFRGFKSPVRSLLLTVLYFPNSFPTKSFLPNR